MRERYKEKLKQLSEEVLDMGALCEQAVMGTYHLLVSPEKKAEIIREIDRLEGEIDSREGVVESICMQLLLRQQPVASDLRLISASLKIVTDLERIGDYATDIAEILDTGSVHVPVKDVHLSKMAEFTISHINQCMQAYMKQDLKLAKETVASDDEVDQLFLKVRSLLHENAMDYTEDQAMDLMMMAKYYERIGDHAANIGEWVEFCINGFHRSGSEVYDVFGLHSSGIS